MHWKSTSKRRGIFDRQNYFENSPLKWLRFFSHRNYVETTSSFHSSKLHRKSFWKRFRNSSIFQYSCIDVISTSDWRQFDILFPLETQLFVVPPVIIRPELFKSQRPNNLKNHTFTLAYIFALNLLVKTTQVLRFQNYIRRQIF